LIRRPQSISTAAHGAASRERIAVTVVANGYLWRETTYAILSTIARGVTGTAWSGPRFFGVHCKDLMTGGWPFAQEDVHLIVAVEMVLVFPVAELQSLQKLVGDVGIAGGGH
jgi:hypothetical protein